nr:ribonuclease H-like domain, reverse transcriptase, RNA-dependent DNA polymerase [Tanacetum cinerariifolium]
MVYLGSEPGSKAYCLFDPITTKIYVSRDVKFKEDETWNWEEFVKDFDPKEPEWSDFIIQNNKTQETEETKRDANGKILKHKARLVAKGYFQDHGIDFDEVFTPVARIETIRLILALVAYNKWEVHHLDVKSAFLHGDLKEDVYVSQPDGFIKTEDKGKVYRYATKILKDTGMLDCNDAKIPMEPGLKLTKLSKEKFVDPTKYQRIIGCLHYLLHTRPDISFPVRLLSRFMQEPQEQHMKAIKQVLRYNKGTKDYGITYRHDGNKIQGYSDSSYGVNTQEGKCTTRIVFYFGNLPITWSTQKQGTVALSSCESEFIATTAAATQAL